MWMRHIRSNCIWYMGIWMWMRHIRSSCSFSYELESFEFWKEKKVGLSLTLGSYVRTKSSFYHLWEKKSMLSCVKYIDNQRSPIFYKWSPSEGSFGQMIPGQERWSQSGPPNYGKPLQVVNLIWMMRHGWQCLVRVCMLVRLGRDKGDLKHSCKISCHLAWCCSKAVVYRDSASGRERSDLREETTATYFGPRIKLVYWFGACPHKIL